MYGLVPRALICKTRFDDLLFLELTTSRWVFSSLQPKDQLKGHDYYTVNPANRKEGYKLYSGYDGGSQSVEGLVYTEKGM